MDDNFFQFTDDASEPTEEKFISGRSLLEKQVDFLPMLFGNVIPQVGLWALVGASDTAKSMLLRQLAMCVASNQSFVSMECKASCNRAIVVCSEDDDNAISYLLRKQNKSIGITHEQAENLTFLFDTFDFIQQLEAELIRQPAGLVILDAFGDLFDGKDGNQNSQVRQFLNQFSQIANRHKCSICFLHHTGKRTENLAPSKNNAIGSQGFEAKMRLVIEMRLDKTDPNLRHLCIVKGNYVPQLEKQASIVVRMDENLTFTDTGDRVDFDELNANDNGKANEKNPANFSEDTHCQFIRHTFVSDKKVHSQNELVKKLHDYYEISDKTARKFVDHMERSKWIVDVSTNVHRKQFRKNIS